jgi:hypothetical protein
MITVLVLALTIGRALIIKCPIATKFREILIKVLITPEDSGMGQTLWSSGAGDSEQDGSWRINVFMRV